VTQGPRILKAPSSKPGDEPALVSVMCRNRPLGTLASVVAQLPTRSHQAERFRSFSTSHSRLVEPQVERPEFVGPGGRLPSRGRGGAPLLPIGHTQAFCPSLALDPLVVDPPPRLLGRSLIYAQGSELLSGCLRADIGGGIGWGNRHAIGGTFFMMGLR
jgi:hypothetical protein